MLNESNIPLEEDGIEEEILVDEEVAITKAMWGDVGGNIENQTDLQNALDAKQDSLTEAQLNAVNSGITSEKVTTYDGYADQIASKADQSALNAETIARGEADTALGTRIDNEVLARQQADNGLQSQIDAITSKSDVVDVVANYAALQAYDTSTLGNNDVVKVLDDETHEDALTYYRWSTTTQTWTYIGQEAPYYSKGQMDVKLAEKQDKLTAGANIQIQNGTISATDTKYTNGNGLNLNGTEFSADTDVLATKEDLEGYYTKPETDNLLAPKLEAEVVAELPTTGAEGKLYLTPKAHTTLTATGNPIEATITEQAGQLESFQLDGDTFQQTYTGKNLFNPAAYVSVLGYNAQRTLGNDGSITWVNTTSDSYFPWIHSDSMFGNNAIRSATIPVQPSTQYTVSLKKTTATAANLYVYEGDSDYVGIKNTYANIREETSYTFTTSETTRYVILRFAKWASQETDVLSEIQLEAGSTATAYEPFVNGQPSPNPDYPQQIQTVTGTQTISVNGTNYPISLGSLELCKLGTYQDYIWKDGGDWKVHKSVGKAELWKGTNWRRLNTSIAGENRFSVKVSNTDTPTSASSDTLVHLNSNYWPACSRIQTYQQTQGIAVTGASDFSVESFIAFVDSLKTSDVDGWKAWLTANMPVVYYPSTTPTDTVITDQTLIAQLESIRTASLENGTNTITNTATGTNLAGDMEIGYFGFNPTNRYDKWLWLDINNNYEQIGGE